MYVSHKYADNIKLTSFPAPLACRRFGASVWRAHVFFIKITIGSTPRCHLIALISSLIVTWSFCCGTLRQTHSYLKGERYESVATGVLLYMWTPHLPEHGCFGEADDGNSTHYNHRRRLRVTPSDGLTGSWWKEVRRWPVKALHWALSRIKLGNQKAIPARTKTSFFMSNK